MIKDLVVAGLVLGSFSVGAATLVRETRAPWPQPENQMLVDDAETEATPAYASTYVISASATRCE